MMNYIIKIINALKYIRDLGWNLEQKRIPRLEITEKGFCIKYHWSLFGPREKIVSWADVSEIRTHMVDCYSTHRLFMEFFLGSENKFVSINQEMFGWTLLYAEILKQFPDFSVENFKKVEDFFPKEAGLVCWKRKE